MLIRSWRVIIRVHRRGRNSRAATLPSGKGEKWGQSPFSRALSLSNVKPRCDQTDKWTLTPLFFASQRQRTRFIGATGAGFKRVPLIDSPEKPVLEWPPIMLDPRLIREHLKEVRASLGARAQDIDWDGLHKLDKERGALLTKVEELRHKRKTVSDQIANLKRNKQPGEALMEEMRGVGDRLKSLEDSLRDAEDLLNAFALRIPNIPHPSVPIGADPSANQEIRCWGKPPALTFPPKHHWELGESLGILGFERAARMTGARFAVYSGAGARLERADRKSVV